MTEKIDVKGEGSIVNEMNKRIYWMIIIAEGGTIEVKDIGVIKKVSKGRFNTKHSQKLMRFRIAF